VASTQHVLRTSHASFLRFAKWPRTQFANFLKYKYKVPEVQVFQNTSCLRTSTYKNVLQALEVLQPYFKASKGISRTSLRRGVLTRFAIKIFFLRFAQCEKTKKFIPMSYVRGQLFKCPQPRIPFLWFTSSGVHKQPTLFEVLAPASFFIQGSHVQRQYWKRITLCSESSTIIGPLYASDPDNCEKGTLSDQPRLLCVSSTVLLCCWGRSCSKIWRPL
jgi:hypothetical protein